MPVPVNIQQHLDQCSFCTEQYENLLEQFRQADEQFISIPKQMIDTLATSKAGGSENKFCIIAGYREENDTAKKQFPRIQMRAGDTSSPDPQTRYQNHGVLSADDGAILIRIIEDIQTQDISLHLIADDDQKVKNVPVTITPGQRELITDQFGRINLGSLELPQTKDLKVTIHTPRAEFDLSILEMKWRERIGQGEILVENQCNEHIYVEFQPEGETYKLVLRLDTSQIAEGKQKVQIIAEKESQPSRIGEVTRGVAVFHDVKPDQQIRVIIFG